ncbi:DNA-binding transcriptional regulator, LysR family [Thalassovita litoralis]|jgi:DNA-binding transcriptional LysR family regulator|uniref:DNA-binding transcriptional regulator, LysR family n=1 Tax=Thalassovita litoralis TaxID=1010611 RepID=A0A521BL25_9RHOB|nr:LysR family transcriptional regulator [Thalassovita litoralis]SMO47864.1 DNA-binding transcriptional regulator, LysR family [Thalassovita litoralis]
MATDPFALDFSALRVLRLVHGHGSFSRTAESLGVTQSTVSYTMARLRDAFGDPLFVRQGAGIVPTDRCEEVVAQTSAMLDRFEALTAPRQFDPAVAKLEIGISCNYYERVTLIPKVMRTLRQKAPGMAIRIISSTVRGKEQLMRGDSDMLIGPIRLEEPSFFRRGLLPEDYVCIMDPANPLARTVQDVDTFVAAPQVVVNYGGSFRSRFLVVMEAQGHYPNAVMEVPSPANLPDILVGTDMIATVPRRIAESFGAQVVIRDCPFLAEISIDLYWTARTHVSAPHVWLRAQIAAAANRILTKEAGAG